MNRVFFSYSSSDSACAHRVYSELKARGAACWIAPNDATAGRDYAEEIVEQIQACDYFLLLVSAQAQKSDQVRGELNMAVAYKKNIMPVLLEDTPISGVYQYHIGFKQWVKYYEDADRALAALAAVICPSEGAADLPDDGADTQSLAQHAVLKEPDPGPARNEMPDQRSNPGCFWGFVWLLRGGIAVLALGVIYVIYYLAVGDIQTAVTDLKAIAIMAGFQAVVVLPGALSASPEEYLEPDGKPQPLWRIILRFIKFVFVGSR